MRPRGNLHHCTTRNSCEASESSVTLGTPVVDTIHQRVFLCISHLEKKTTPLAFSVTCHTTAIPARLALNIDLTSGRDESYPLTFVASSLSLSNSMPPFCLGSTALYQPWSSCHGFLVQKLDETFRSSSSCAMLYQAKHGGETLGIFGTVSTTIMICLCDASKD